MISEDDRDQLWEEFLEMEFHIGQLRHKIRQTYQNEKESIIIELLKKDLSDVEKRFLLYQVVQSMPMNKQMLMAEELLPLAAMSETKRSTNPAETLVISWGHEWLSENLFKISRSVVKRISNGEFKYIDLSGFYSGLIRIFLQFDKNIAKKLMQELLSSEDADMKAMGISWQDDFTW